MAPVAKRRINPVPITISSNTAPFNALNGGQNHVLGPQVPGATHSNVRNQPLDPEGESNAAKAAGLVGRRLYVKLNKNETTTVSFKRLLAAAGVDKVVVPEVPAEPANPLSLHAFADRNRKNPLSLVIANLEKRQMREMGGSSSSGSDSEGGEDDDNESGDDGSPHPSQENSGSEGRGSESEEKSNSNDESGADSENEEKLPKKERIGDYDLEDDWIDDSDIIDIMRASKRKAKLDGFFVIKGKVEREDDDNPDGPARLKSKKRPKLKRRRSGQMDAGSGKENGIVKKRKKQGPEAPNSVSPKKKKKRISTDMVETKLAKEGVEASGATVGPQKPPPGSNKDIADGAFKGLSIEDLQPGLAGKFKTALDSLRPIADKLKIEHAGVVAMSIPKTINDSLSEIGCLMNHDMSQAPGVRDLMLDTVHDLFAPIFSKGKLRLRLDAVAKSTKDDMLAVPGKLKSRIESKLQQADEKRSAGDPDAKFTWDKNLDHNVLTYASSFSKVHCQDPADLSHLKDLLELWPDGSMDIETLKLAMMRAIQNPKVARKPRKSVDSSDLSASAHLEARNSDAVRKLDTLPSIPEEAEGALHQSPKHKSCESGTDSEATQSDSDDPARKQETAGGPDHKEDKLTSPQHPIQQPSPSAAPASGERNKPESLQVKPSGDTSATHQNGTAPQSVAAAQSAQAGPLQELRHQQPQTTAAQKVVPSVKGPAVPPQAASQAAPQSTSPATNPIASQPVIQQGPLVQRGSLQSSQLGEEQEVRPTQDRPGSGLRPIPLGDQYSDATLLQHAISKGGKLDVIQASLRRFAGHQVRTIMNKVLLHAGPEGLSAVEVLRRADEFGLTGDQPWSKLDASERKKLSAQLRATSHYLMYINTATFAHSAFPGVKEAAEKLADDKQKAKAERVALAAAVAANTAAKPAEPSAATSAPQPGVSSLVNQAQNPAAQAQQPAGASQPSAAQKQPPAQLQSQATQGEVPAVQGQPNTARTQPQALQGQSSASQGRSQNGQAAVPVSQPANVNPLVTAHFQSNAAAKPVQALLTAAVPGSTQAVALSGGLLKPAQPMQTQQTSQPSSTSASNGGHLSGLVQTTALTLPTQSPRPAAQAPTVTKAIASRPPASGQLPGSLPQQAGVLRQSPVSQSLSKNPLYSIAQTTSFMPRASSVMAPPHGSTMAQQSLPTYQAPGGIYLNQAAMQASTGLIQQSMQQLQALAQQQYLQVQAQAQAQLRQAAASSPQNSTYQPVRSIQAALQASQNAQASGGLNQRLLEASKLTPPSLPDVQRPSPIRHGPKRPQFARLGSQTLLEQYKNLDAKQRRESPPTTLDNAPNSGLLAGERSLGNLQPNAPDAQRIMADSGKSNPSSKPSVPSGVSTVVIPDSEEGDRQIEAVIDLDSSEEQP